MLEDLKEVPLLVHWVNVLVRLPPIFKFRSSTLTSLLISFFQRLETFGGSLVQPNVIRLNVQRFLYCQVLIPGQQFLRMCLCLSVLTFLCVASYFVNKLKLL